MKRSLLILASAALLFSGCAKEKFADTAEGGLQEVTFTTSLDGDVSKASIDNDGNGANVNRCIMEIYFQNELYKRMVEPAVAGVATFSNVPVVAGKEYEILFWADHVDVVNTEAGLATDKYYTTKTTTNNKGLKAVTVKKADFIDALKNKKNDELDAFSFADKYTVPQGGKSYTAKLKRPFAQLNVITTDVAAGKTVTSADLLPETVTVSYTAATIFNVADSTATGSATYEYTAPVYGDKTNWTAVKNRGELTLSMDYILADKEQRLVNVTFVTKNDGQSVMTHNLTNLPYQRNYRTNVKGDLLTAGGTWKATVDPIWSEPAYNTVIPNSYLEALAAVATNNVNKVVITDNVVADYKEKRAQGQLAEEDEYSQLPLSDTEKEALKTRETADGRKYIMFVLKTTSPVAETFELPDPTEGGVENYGWYIYHEPEYPTQELEVITTEPDMDVIIDAPTTHATVNGQEYNSVVSFTSPTTLVIPDNVAIKEKIEAKQGNILCFGTLLEGCNVILAPAHDDVPASEFYYGIHSDVSVDNYNTKRTYTPDVINFMVAEGKVTDGTTVSVVKESIINGNGAEAYTEGGVNLVKSEKLSGELKFDNQNKVTIKSGTFADKLTFTTDKVYIENGDFNEVVAPEGAAKFIAGGIYTVKPLAKYVVLGYEATAVSTQAGTRYIITKVSSDYIVRITRGGEYLYATGNYGGYFGRFNYVMQFGSPKVESGDYLELLKDLEGDNATSQITHSDQIKYWTLDLCGHSMTASRSTDVFADSGSSSASVLWAQGEIGNGLNQITFTDSSAEGNGRIENTANDDKPFSAALGLCENCGIKTTWIFDGGNYISNKDAIYFEKGTITVNGGTFSGQNAIKGFCAAGTGNLNLTINGGQFDGNISLSNKTATTPADYQKAHASITAGTFNGDLVIGENVDLTISGGKFLTASGSKFLVDGKYLSETEGYFVVGDSQPASYLASVNDKAFFTSDANKALEIAISGDVVVLKANTTYVRTLQEGEDLTILAETGISYAAPVAAEGFELVITDVTGGKKYSVPKVGVFKVTSGITVLYDGDDMQSAVNKLNSGYTLKVMKDVVVSGAVTISTGNGGIIDLNGHSVEFTNIASGKAALTINKSSGSPRDYVITDNSLSKEGCMSRDGNGNQLIRVSNAGSLKISGGTYRHDGGEVFSSDVGTIKIDISNSKFYGETFHFAFNSTPVIGSKVEIVTTTKIYLGFSTATFNPSSFITSGLSAEYTYKNSQETFTTPQTTYGQLIGLKVE